MDETGRDDLLATFLPQALEVMTAWDIAEGDDHTPGDPAEFVAAMDRVVSDVAEAGHRGSRLPGKVRDLSGGAPRDPFVSIYCI